MSKSIIKKIVSVIACISMLAGYASISNAYSIDPGYSATIAEHDDSDYYYYTYEYTVSYIHFDGLATGAYMNGLTVYVNSDYVCAVNTSHKTGPYHVSVNDYNYYKLYNDTSKHVAIDIDFTIDEYYR